MKALTLGDRVRERRIARGMSQGELERAAGLKSRGFISALEANKRGKKPSKELISGLALALYCTEEWLLHGGKDPEEASLVPKLRLVRRETEGEDQFPCRAQFIALLGAEADPDVVKALRLERHATGEDPGVVYWRGRYGDLAKQRRRALADLRAVTDLDD